VARQPILTADQKIYGYELLFRDGLKNYVAKEDTPAASRNTLDVATLMGLDVLCDGHLAFINCTAEDLANDYITLLPASQTVVELLGDVAPEEEVVAACKRLKQAGYMLALDDFVMNDPREPLIDLADLLKVDVKITSPQKTAALAKQYAHRGVRILAKKVETQEEFVAAKKAGCEYFQGYFFRKPELRATGPMPTNRASYLRLLQAASNPEFDAAAIEKAVKTDASFCYRLLRYLNSASFGFSNEIHSVRHAIFRRGARSQVRARLLGVSLQSVGRRQALLRARESRSRHAGRHPIPGHHRRPPHRDRCKERPPGLERQGGRGRGRLCHDAGPACDQRQGAGGSGRGRIRNSRLHRRI
jgi:EAL and modified HD-GYP domain-containing signal transduction protein